MGPDKTYFYHRSLVPSIAAYTDVSKRSGAGMDNMSPKQIINTVAGDHNYYNELLDHYDRVPSEYWSTAGLAYNRKSAELYGDSKLPVYPNVGKSASVFLGYPPKTTNSLVELPSYMKPHRSLIVGINSSNKKHASDIRYLQNHSKNIRSNDGYTSSYLSGPVGTDQPSDAARGTSLHHEMLHLSMVPGKTNNMFVSPGGRSFTGAPFYYTYLSDGNDPVLVSAKELYNYSPHGGLRGRIFRTPRFGEMFNDLRRVKKEDKLSLTAKEYANFGFTPYDLDEIELTQAVSSYNQNRHNLATNIRKNMVKYMLAGFEPWKLKWVTMQPKFYSADGYGKDRFIADMEFYRKNPAMAELLGTAGRRVIPSYHNMTRALESKDPKNRELQDKIRYIRDRFINYRILGNNRTTPRPQYTNTTGTAIG